jgi:hypothetical protein
MSLNQLLGIILSEWAGGISVGDKVVDELRSLLTPTAPPREVTETRTETRTETKTEVRSLRLVHGNSIKATAEAGN